MLFHKPNSLRILPNSIASPPRFSLSGRMSPLTQILWGISSFLMPKKSLWPLWTFPLQKIPPTTDTPPSTARWNARRRTVSSPSFCPSTTGMTITPTAMARAIAGQELPVDGSGSFLTAGKRRSRFWTADRSAPNLKYKADRFSRGIRFPFPPGAA